MGNLCELHETAKGCYSTLFGFKGDSLLGEFGGQHR
jgi:hypothetical protein